MRSKGTIILSLLAILSLAPAGLQAQSQTQPQTQSEPKPIVSNKPFAFHKIKKVMNENNEFCQLNGQDQCCNFTLQKGNPVSFRIRFNRNTVSEFMRIYNTQANTCEYMLYGEVKVPVRLNRAEAQNTLIGGSSDKVTLELLSSEPCQLAVFWESVSSFRMNGPGIICAGEPKFPEGVKLADPAKAAEPAPAAEKPAE